MYLFLKWKQVFSVWNKEADMYQICIKKCVKEYFQCKEISISDTLLEAPLSWISGDWKPSSRFKVQNEVRSKGWDRRRAHSRSRMLYNIAVALLCVEERWGWGSLVWGCRRHTLTSALQGVVIRLIVMLPITECPSLLSSITWQCQCML